MKPVAFAVLLLGLILLGGAGGAGAGYLLHEGTPFERMEGQKPTLGSVIVENFVGREAVAAAYEEERRRMAARGLAGGSVLGFLSALAIGGYSLRYRAGSR